MKFQLKKGCGLHVERGPHGLKTYKPGDVIETNNELDVMFKSTGKFVRLSEDEDKGSVAAAGEAEVAALPPQPVADQYGMDVTAVSWAVLLDTPYRVYQRGRWFNVIEAETGVRLNDKNLTKDQVSAYVAEIIPEAEE